VLPLRLVSVFLSLPPRHLSRTHFPYTTLFRSHLNRRSASAVSRGTRWASSGHNVTRPWAIRRSPAATWKPSRASIEAPGRKDSRSEEHTSELQSRFDLVCRLLLEKKNHIPDRT